MPTGDVWLDAACNEDGLGHRSIRADSPTEIFAWSLGDPTCPFEELEGRTKGRFAVALLGYELGQLVEPVAAWNRRAEFLPDLWIASYSRVNVNVGALSSAAVTPCMSSDFSTDMTFETYAERVKRALEYIRAGDVYQVNLSHRLRSRIEGDPRALYARLREQTPAPLGAHIDGGSFQILSNSPELFLRYEASTRMLETRPIKGTRPRSTLPHEDRLLREACASDPKERAEHVMIVDLLRNDLGRISEIGSVRTEDLHRIVSLPTVHHAVTTVSGRVRPNVGLAKILRATFPGGSITGAPKVRAMQIIRELEPAPRGLYTGCIGFFEPDGSFTLSIAIRTAIVSDSVLDLQVGGGIVADSTPQSEWQETWHKAAAFRRALGLEVAA